MKAISFLGGESRHVGATDQPTYNLHIALASIPSAQRERSLQASVLLLQQDKCLVRSLALAIVLCRQADGEGVLCAEGDWGLER